MTALRRKCERQVDGDIPAGTPMPRRDPEYFDNAVGREKRLGRSQPSRHGTRQRLRPDQRHDAGDGVDDRLRHLYRVGGDFARSRFACIADWGLAVAGFMTIVAALSYGELAAMMPRAGGQYVYLREALGPLWGFLYGWTLFLVIQTGTIAAVGVAFGKFLGVFFPSISSTHWMLHLWKVPPIPIGPMVLGNMDVGINTQNLVAILLVVVFRSSISSG